MTEIQSRLRTSELGSSVAALIDYAAQSTSQEMVNALTRNASQSEISAIVKKECAHIADSLDFRLNVGIYPLEKCPSQDVVHIDGVPFALPFEMRELLANYILDYAEGRFLLKNGDRVFLRFRDVQG